MLNVFLLALFPRLFYFIFLLVFSRLLYLLSTGNLNLFCENLRTDFSDSLVKRFFFSSRRF